MKKRRLVIILSLCIMAICSFTIVGCSTGGSPKLSTPVVSISSTGIASWGAVENAVGYVYKIDDEAETQTTDLSVQLTDGQTIKVKALGDGETYLNSAFSVPKTYAVGGTGGNGGNGGNDGDQGSSGGNQGGTDGNGGTSGGNASGGNTSDGNQGGNTSGSNDGNQGGESGDESQEHQHQFTISWQTTATQHVRISVCDCGQVTTDQIGLHIDGDRNNRCDLCNYALPSTDDGESGGNDGDTSGGEQTKPDDNQDGTTTKPDGESGGQGGTTGDGNVSGGNQDGTITNPDDSQGGNVSGGNDGNQGGNTSDGNQDGTTGGENQEHQHNYSESWQTTSTQHVKICICDCGTIITEEASAHVDGDRNRVCDLCNYEITSSSDNGSTDDNGEQSGNGNQNDQTDESGNGGNETTKPDDVTCNHADDNGDGVCDICRKNLKSDDQTGKDDGENGDTSNGGNQGGTVTNPDGDQDIEQPSNPYIQINDGTNGSCVSINGENKASINLDLTLVDKTLGFEKIEIYLDNDDPIYDYANGEVIDGTVTEDGVIVGTMPSSTPKTPDFSYSKAQLEQMGFDGTHSFTDGILSGRNYVVRIYYDDTNFVRAYINTPEYKIYQVENNAYIAPRAFTQHLLVGIDIGTSEYDVDEEGNKLDIYVKNYAMYLVVFDQTTNQEVYRIRYDQTDQTEFFNSGIEYNFRYTDRTSYFVVVRDYFTKNFDRDNVVWKMVFETDKNDGNGTQSYEQSFYVGNFDYGEIYDYDFSVEVDKLTAKVTLTETYDVSKGYLYKVSVYNENQEYAKDIYRNESHSIDEEIYLQMHITAIKERASDPEYGWIIVDREGDADKSYSYYRNYFEDFEYPSANDYFGGLTHTAETVSFTANLDGLEVGYYHLRAFFRYYGRPYDEGEAEYNEDFYLVKRFDYAFVSQGNKLIAPSISIDQDTRVVSWNAVTNANYYEIRVNGNVVETTEQTSTENLYWFNLSDGDVVEVRALYCNVYYSGGYENSGEKDTENNFPNGNPNGSLTGGVEVGDHGLPPLYPSSNWSNSVTFELPKLKTPSVTLQNNHLLIWEDVENADAYVAEITYNGTTREEHVSSGVTFVPGSKVRIKAIDYDGQYGDSQWSSSKTISKYFADGK